VGHYPANDLIPRRPVPRRQDFGPCRMPGPDVELPGCYFAARCPRAEAICAQHRPPLMPMGPGHRAACWHPLIKDGVPQEAPQPAEEVPL